MASTEQSSRSRSPRPRKNRPPSLTPLFPLILLETLQHMDAPEEVLEDEDVSLSLPRRLGLSTVVRTQVRRFQEEVRHHRLQSADSVIDLIRLVIRRPDAEETCTEAGRRMAEHFWDERSGFARAVIRIMPGPFARLTAQRAIKRIFRRLAGDGSVSVKRWPAELRIRGSLTAEADPGGAACAFYAGVFTEVLRLHTGRRYRAVHAHCEARGDSECTWTVEMAV